MSIMAATKTPSVNVLGHRYWNRATKTILSVWSYIEPSAGKDDGLVRMIDLVTGQLISTAICDMHGQFDRIKCYRDMNDNGVDYTVYHGKCCKGAYLADDQTLVDLCGENWQSIVEGGIDNRSNR